METVLNPIPQHEEIFLFLPFSLYETIPAPDEYEWDILMLELPPTFFFVVVFGTMGLEQGCSLYTWVGWLVLWTMLLVSVALNNSSHS